MKHSKRPGAQAPCLPVSEPEINSNSAFFIKHRAEDVPISDPTASTKTTGRTAGKTTATVLSHCTVDPGAIIDHTARRANAAEELQHRKHYRPGLIEAFFGYEALNDISGYESLESKLYSNGRWNVMTFPEAGDILETTSNDKFHELVENIQDHFTHSKRRGFRNTQYEHYLLRDGDLAHWLSPDITFWGQDTGSFHKSSRNSSPHSSPPEFKWCIVILEGKLDKTRKDEDDDQLAAYIREVFSAQFNRRFIPSFIFTQSKLKFYYFDRSGVLYGDEFNYHSEPKKFVGIIRSLLEWDEERLGFDRTIKREEDLWFIKTQQEDTEGNRTLQRYIVDEALFHSTALVGDCPAIWRVKKEDEYVDVHYLIKDAWINGGSAEEGALLERARSHPGVATIISHEDIMVERTNKRDSTLNFRLLRRSVNDNFLVPEDRIHTRIVMRLNGRAKPLEMFSSRMELLTALRDAVAGHHNLYTSGILHRDISPFCILIQPDAIDGNRGVLFDLHTAVGTPSTPRQGDNPEFLFPASLADRLGSRPFHSLHALECGTADPHTHHYVHDLESFYYTLCYIVTCHSGPGPIRISPTPQLISRWFSKQSASHKLGFLVEMNFPLKVPQFFGDAMKTLLQNMHTFIRDRVQALIWRRDWSAPAIKDYGIFLSYLDEAITTIQKEDQNNKRPPSETLAKSPVKRGKRELR